MSNQSKPESFDWEALKGTIFDRHLHWRQLLHTEENQMLGDLLEHPDKYIAESGVWSVIAKLARMLDAVQDGITFAEDPAEDEIDESEWE